MARRPRNRSRCSGDAIDNISDRPSVPPCVGLVSANQDEVPLSAKKVEPTTTSSAFGTISLSPILQGPIPVTDWQICGDAVIGLAHRRKGLPCQDAITYRNAPRPILALSDGAGSAAVSERGAQALVIGIARFLRSMEDELAHWLDEEEGDSSQLERWVERLLLHAQGMLDDLARLERRNVRDVRATLQLVVVGERNVFWWKVGDGAIVVQNSAGLRSLGNQAISKGEFANQTCFVDTVRTDDVEAGLLPTAEIFGVALMSDGGAERLVSHDGEKVANRLGRWFDEVAEQQFTIDRIALAFHEPAMWERTNLDDRSIVLAARAKNAAP